jgi:hypothetical protein
MFKRYAAFICVIALVIVAVAPATAMAATATRTGTYNGDTNLKMIVTYSPGSSDYISSVYASEVSTARCYRKMQCQIVSQSVYRVFDSSTPLTYAFSETKTWYPGKYVSGSWNSTSVTFWASPWSWLMVGYKSLAANDL